MTRFTLIYERGDQPSNVEPRRRYDDIRLLGVLFGFHYMHRQTPPLAHPRRAILASRHAEQFGAKRPK